MTAIEDFETCTMIVGEHEVAYDIGGSGPPVLLLHGFPETRLAWRSVAPKLMSTHTVVCPDLPGYGGSARLEDGPQGFDKSLIASHMIELMHGLGHERFAVVGHDRGGLVAFRAALDHPDTVTHLGVLDILPTVDNWRALLGVGGVFAFHLYFLAQPNDLPERLIGADPDTFFGHFLDTWTRRPEVIESAVRKQYLTLNRRPETIHAICDDYRASAFIDSVADEKDQRDGRQLAMPVLAAWQDPGDTPLPFDPEQIWQSWAEQLHTIVLPCGHFLPEELPDDVATAITELLGSGGVQ